MGLYQRWEEFSMEAEELSQWTVNTVNVVYKYGTQLQKLFSGDEIRWDENN